MPSRGRACGAKPQALLPPCERWALTMAGYNSWRYSHRHGDALLDLLGELVRWPHVRLSMMRRCRRAMPRHPSADEPGKEHNKWLRRKHRAQIEAMERRVAEWKGAGRELMRVLGLASEARSGEEREARELREAERERIRRERERVASESWRKIWSDGAEELERLCRQAFEYCW